MSTSYQLSVTPVDGRIDPDALHAAVMALAIPGYLGLNVTGPLDNVQSVYALFSDPISSEDADRLAVLAAAYMPPRRRRPRDVAAIAADLEALPPARLLRLLRWFLARTAATHPRLLRDLGEAIDGDEVEP